MKESLFHVIIESVGEVISGKTVKLVASMMYLYKRQQIQVKSLKMLRVKASLLGLILVLLVAVYLVLMQVLMLQNKRVIQR